jgi:RNA polymerase sigma-70 factor, ECF subfamily
MLPDDPIADQALSRTRTLRPVGRRAPDPESLAWLTALSSEGRERDDARRRLRALLLRAARSELRRRARTNGGNGHPPLDDLAISATEDALTAIARDLCAYSGQSRFTTWAAKFVLYEAAVQFRVHAWLGRSLPPDSDGLAQLVGAQRDGDIDAEETAEQLCRVRSLLTGHLTEHQRFVVIALALNEVPIDVLAQRLGTTRGALYEALREARLAIRSGLLVGGGEALPAG